MPDGLCRSLFVAFAAALLSCVLQLRPALALPSFTASAIISEPNGTTFSAATLTSDNVHFTVSHGAVVLPDPASGVWRYVCHSPYGLALANPASDPQPDAAPLTAQDLSNPQTTLSYLRLSANYPTPTLADRLQGPSYPVSQDQSTVPLVAIVIGFDGGDAGNPTPYHPAFNWSDDLFGPSSSISAYWRKMSAGSFAFTPAWETSAYGGANANTSDAVGDGVVHVTLHREHGWWNDASNMAQLDDMIAMLAEATSAADSYLDFSRYDTNASGNIESTELAVVYVVAGYEAAVLGGPAATVPSFWSRAGSWDTTGDPGDLSPLSMDGVRLDRCIAIAETMWYPETGAERVGVTSVAVHELGHNLGLPDLYDTYYSGEAKAQQPWGAWQVGGLSVMADGYQGATGDPADPSSELVPVALDAWSRYVLGWTRPHVATGSGTYELRSQNAPGGYTSLLVPTSDPRTYLLLENREPEGQDRSLSHSYPDAGGVVVWLVDKDRFLESSFWNNINVAAFRPAVMPVYPERDSTGAYTLSCAGTVPDTAHPFWRAGTTQELYGSDFLEPLLYAKDAQDNDPAARHLSGVRLRFEDEPGQVMHVNVTLDDAVAHSSRDLQLKDAWASRSSALGKTVCTAFQEETVAGVAMVSYESLRSGLDLGTLTYRDLYGVLDPNALLRVYEIDGPDLKSLLERVLAVQLACSQAQEEAKRDGGRGAEEQLAEAGELMSVTGLMLTVDWNQPEGRRIVSASKANGSEIDFTSPASLVMCTTDVGKTDTYPQLKRLRPYPESLWGSANDALRSLVERTGWEQLVSNAAS